MLPGGWGEPFCSMARVFWVVHNTVRADLSAGWSLMGMRPQVRTTKGGHMRCRRSPGKGSIRDEGWACPSPGNLLDACVSPSEKPVSFSTFRVWHCPLPCPWAPCLSPGASRGLPQPCPNPASCRESGSPVLHLGLFGRPCLDAEEPALWGEAGEHLASQVSP